MSNISKIDRFSLLCLPQVALQEVLKTMTPIELIDISKTSLKSKEIVKSFLNTKQCKREYKIKLDIDISLKISIDGTSSSYTIGFESCHFPSKLHFLDGNEKNIYSENQVRDFKEHLKNVLVIFNRITSLTLVGGPSYSSAGESIIEWLKTIQIPVKRLVMKPCDVSGIRNFKEETVDYILNSLIVNDDIDLYINMDGSFRPAIPPLSNRLYIYDGRWITLSKILKYDCPIIRTGFLYLTNQDINKFIKSWINLESHLNLQYFEMRIIDGNMDESCNGLEIKTIHPNFVRSMFQEPEKVEIVGGIEIRRNDGVTATLSLSLDRFRMMINQV